MAPRLASLAAKTGNPVAALNGHDAILAGHGLERQLH
jgi:hypothetical protein